MTDKVVQPARRPVPDSVVFDAGGLEQDEARAIRRVGHDARTPRRVAGAGADEIATGGSALRQNNSFGCGMTRFDVAIVGAGMGGLMAGALLAQRGRRVIVAEAADRIGGYQCRLESGGSVIEPHFPSRQPGRRGRSSQSDASCRDASGSQSASDCWRRR